VSVDLAVWEGERPSGDSEARVAFDDLGRRFLGRRRVAPTDRIAEYVRALLARYPDLADPGGDEVVVPWGSGPLLANASGPIFYVDLKLSAVFEEGWRYCVETAERHGLVAFDPQAGTLASPDATVPAGEWSPDPARRGGAAYRWVSLRSWRWPFLRPLLPLLRRFP
jgi:hypothetical protein